jgi:hypothetical protein
MGKKGTAAPSAMERERVRTLGVVGRDPAQHGVGPPARAHGHLGGAAALGDVEQSKRPLARAGVRCAQGQVTQVLRRPTPARAINTDHET